MASASSEVASTLLEVRRRADGDVADRSPSAPLFIRSSRRTNISSDIVGFYVWKLEQGVDLLFVFILCPANDSETE